MPATPRRTELRITGPRRDHPARGLGSVCLAAIAVPLILSVLAAPASAATDLGVARLPLAFEPNRKQIPGEADFVARGSGCLAQLAGGDESVRIGKTRCRTSDAYQLGTDP